jgi:glycerol-3-phosphate dehydrogenase subunit C
MSDDIRASLDSCVKCTICETFCPVSAATPLFPGPKYAGPQAERYRAPGTSADASLDYCSGCGICTQVCPQGVHIAEINARARARMRAERGMPLRDRLIARPALLGRLARPVAPVANAVVRSRLARRAVEAALGIHRDAALPSFAFRTLQARSGGGGGGGTTERRSHPPRRGPSSIFTAVRPTTTSPTSARWRSTCSSTTGSR